VVKSYVFIFLGLLCLASCGPNPQTLALQQYQTMTASCAAQYPDQPPTMAAFQKCKNAAADATVGRFEPYPDLYQLAHADRLEIADQADSGQITLDQANVEIAQLNAQVTQAAEDRNNQNAEAAAQRLSALSNFLSAERALQPPPVQPYYVPVQPTITTNCTGFGSSINCVSH